MSTLNILLALLQIGTIIYLLYVIHQKVYFMQKTIKNILEESISEIDTINTKYLNPKKTRSKCKTYTDK